SRIEDFTITEAFISALQAASLDNDPLPADVLNRLRHPPQQAPDFSDPALRLSIKIHLALTNASQESYNLVREALRDELEFDLLSYSQVKSQIAELSGVVPIVQHMCVNTCVAFTGPFADHDTCPICQEPRYDPHKLRTSRGRVKSPRQVFHTMPLGPQLQARRRHPEMAEKMQYRDQRMQEILASGRIKTFDDLYCGTDLLAAMQKGQITSSDSVLLFSIDGAQLYQSKASDCWIYLWILLDLAPDMRYKKAHILPGGIIPGPNKPKNLDSFLFPGLHHLAALQREGLQVWDAAKSKIVTDHPFLDLIGADTPAMAVLDGLVGPQGRLGCRFYCDYPGRRKPGGSQYYPACLKPLDYEIQGCDHDDTASIASFYYYHEISDNMCRYLRNLQVVRSSRNQAEFRRNRLETGICKPSIFSGLPSSHRLPIPACFPPDLMHLASLNLTDLLLGLWRGVIDCDPDDDKSSWDWMVLRRQVWIDHGKAVGAARSYLPGSFDRPPRNPADKISSGYKAWEFLTYVFGYCPAMLCGILPLHYWQNFCKLVVGVRILHQHRITSAELLHAHKLLIEFCDEFEELYYQRLPSRLHFCRQSVHQMRHAAPESRRTGLLALATQWPMERLIGDLGQEIRQPSNPFANLSQQGVLRAQVNALKSMIPELERDSSKFPRGSLDLGDGFVLLRAMDTMARPISPCQLPALQHYLQSIGFQTTQNFAPAVVRWARLRLPNGQVARSAWKESLKPLSRLRIARNVKVSCCLMSLTDLLTCQIFQIHLHNQVHFAEVQFYFRLTIDGGQEKNLAMVSLFGPPDPNLLQLSSQAVWSCTYGGEQNMLVIDIKSIQSVVGMVPHTSDPTWVDRYFVVERMGLEISYSSIPENVPDE
ncbi:hypothetical protein DENSPDRAFT_766810, partial [Dentipellis sp. KUC8613]